MRWYNGNIQIVNSNINVKDLEIIYHSGNYGDFKIIEDLGMINKSHKVKIKFINTGFESIVHLTQVKYGQVKDNTIYAYSKKISYNEKIYSSNNYGDFIILSDAAKNPNNPKSDRRVIIKFIYTGTIKEVGLQEALSGNVKDEQYCVDFNKTYNTTRSGDIKIISGPYRENKQIYVIVEFLNTGNTKKVRLDHVLSGNVLDDSLIKFSRPGYATNGDSKKFYQLYKRWDCMMHRCYNKDHKNYKYYEAIGVTVCDRWFNFANFIYDVQRIPGYNKFIMNPSDYNLDKDFLQYNIPHIHRIYSPETCIWMHKKDNIKLGYKLDILFSSNCRIIALYNGDYSADIVINNIIVEFGVYQCISDIYDRFLYLMQTNQVFNYPTCYNINKEMCIIRKPVIEMRKIIK